MTAQPQDQALTLIYDLIKTELDRPNGKHHGQHPTFGLDEVKLVWFCYILGGWKALVTTTLPYEMYYEVTYNKEKAETYIDMYKKHGNVVVN